MAWAYGCGVVFAVSTGVMLLMQAWALLTEQATELNPPAQLKQD
jgi:hypothetical protein